jgi:hypothetical protein
MALGIGTKLIISSLLMIDKEAIDERRRKEIATRQIEVANSFCANLTFDTFVSGAPIKTVEMTCGHGHLKKRNAARLKPRQIIPCMEQSCDSVFSINDTSPLTWHEVMLQITCGRCEVPSNDPPRQLVALSYWEKTNVPCLNDDCGHHTEVQWVLSKKLDA